MDKSFIIFTLAWAAAMILFLIGYKIWDIIDSWMFCKWQKKTRESGTQSPSMTCSSLTNSIGFCEEPKKITNIQLEQMNSPVKLLSNRDIKLLQESNDSQNEKKGNKQ